ncbi:TIR domain-containing protein [Thauera sinica]|nr:TIR domain-containing protein [Thauera sp. K11]
MARLFVSYRREDSAGFAGRLTDALERTYGEGSVFRDVDDIRPGEDFAQIIQRGLDEVAAVLVVIGPGWLDAGDAGGRRLERADDFVRREIEGALAVGKPLLPILVGGARMPAAEHLPPSIRPLAARQALVLGDASWKSDLAALEAALQPVLAGGGDEAASTSVPPRGRPPARRAWLLAALGVVLAASLAALVPGWRAEPAMADDIAGTWGGSVEYPWGARHDERFELAVRDGAIVGSASFLGLPRTIESGELRGGRLHFTTRSNEVLGDSPPREVLHRYVGEPGRDEIRFVLESRNGYSANPPTHFVLHRR